MVHTLGLISIALAVCFVTGAPIQSGDNASIQAFRDYAALAKRGGGDIGQAVGDIVNAGIGLGSSHSDVKRNQHPDGEDQFVALTKRDGETLDDVLVDVGAVLDDVTVDILKVKRNTVNSDHASNNFLPP